MKRLFPYFFILIFAYGCIDTMDLPTNSGSGYTGIQNDVEKYAELFPRWTWESAGVSSICDIHIAGDGRLYIADSSADQIKVLRLSGEDAGEDYAPLQNLSYKGNPIHPLAVTTDSRYMVYYTDGGNKVYAWYQFLAQTGVTGVITTRRYSDGVNSVDISPWEYSTNPAYEAYQLVFGHDVIDSTAALIDSLKSPFLFYDPSDEPNKILNPTYASTALKKSFVSLAAGASGDLTLYITDAANDRIVRVYLLPTVLIQLSNGQKIWHYTGIYNGFIAEPGTGAGTVSDPTGMVTDVNGNLYYTQLGDYFGLHKLKAGNYESGFTLGVNEIMDLDQFIAPLDVAIDGANAIYVLDSAYNAVKKFSVSGEYSTLVGVTETWLKVQDTTWTYTESDTTWALKDTLILNVQRDMLKSATVLAAFEDVIYISDTGNQRILRYTLADDITIDLPQEWRFP